MSPVHPLQGVLQDTWSSVTSWTPSRVCYITYGLLSPGHPHPPPGCAARHVVHCYHLDTPTPLLGVLLDTWFTVTTWTPPPPSWVCCSTRGSLLPPGQPPPPSWVCCSTRGSLLPPGHPHPPPGCAARHVVHCYHLDTPTPLLGVLLDTWFTVTTWTPPPPSWVCCSTRGSLLPPGHPLKVCRRSRDPLLPPGHHLQVCAPAHLVRCYLDTVSKVCCRTGNLMWPYLYPLQAVLQDT